MPNPTAGDVHDRNRLFAVGNTGKLGDVAVENLIAGREASRTAEPQEVDHRRPALWGQGRDGLWRGVPVVARRHARKYRRGSERGQPSRL